MKSYRPERVANVVRSVVSDAIAMKLSDPRIAPLSSVTRVEVSADLEHATRARGSGDRTGQGELGEGGARAVGQGERQARGQRCLDAPGTHSPTGRKAWRRRHYGFRL